MYKIRYVKLHSHLIDNVIKPPPHELEEKAEWFAQLEWHILRNGFRNPVVLTAKDGIITPRYGGSRIMIAQKYNFTVPAIVADFEERFPDWKEITLEQIPNYYKDKPKKIIWKNYGLNISGCSDVHMDRL